MKKLLFLLWLLPAACLAQTDSTQVKPHDIYCKIYAVSVGFSSRFSIKYDFGHDSNNGNLSDTEFRKLSKQLDTIDNQIDALNYMAAQGWEVLGYTSSFQSQPTYLLRKKPTM